MQVLFFARLFYPYIGGVEKHVLEVGKRLVKKGYKVTLITENYQSLPLTDKIEGISVIRINAGKEDRFKKFRIWLELFKLLNIISNTDIVHCHDVFFWYLPFRFLFPFKKVYVTFHGYEGNNIPDRKAVIMHKLAEKLSKGNICIGNFYKKWYGTNATFVSFGAVDEKLIAEGKNPPKPNRKAMFLGRLEEEAGIIEYLKAIKGTKTSLDVFGNGSLGTKAKEFARENNLEVNFKGFVANATDYIKNYKYVFTSRYLGILEAMALKKPVFVVYNNSIKKDYLEMTPFSSYISISKDSEELKTQLEKPKVNAEKAYDWVKNQTWEKMVDTYLKLWGRNNKWD